MKTHELTAPAPYKRVPALENSTWYKGILTSQMAGTADNDGAFDLVVSKMRRGTEPPAHVHSREHEMFYIVSGELNVYVDGKVFRVSAGEFMFLPRGVPSDFDGGCAQTALGYGVMAVCSDARQTVNRRCDFASKCRRGVDVGFAPAVLACPRRGCFDGKSGET